MFKSKVLTFLLFDQFYKIKKHIYRTKQANTYIEKKTNRKWIFANKLFTYSNWYESN